MEKLDFNQIIEILKQNFDQVDDFGYEEIPYDTENFSSKALDAQNKLDKWLLDNPNPGYGKHYDKWYKEYNSLPTKYSVARDEWFEKVGIKWEEVEQYGGEGQGSTWYSVKYFPNHDVYIRVDGYYSSYNGTDFDGWDDCTEVRPKEKTITVYESK